MAWRIRANYYEACNCAYGCPCNMNGFPTYGFCEGSVAFQVIEGEKDGVDLGGAKVAAGVKWPGAIHEGNGKAAIFIDATEEQRDALVAILTAQDPGLPWEILAATLSDVHGPFFESVEIADEGGRSSVRVAGGEKFNMQLEPFSNPVTGDVHEPHMVLKDGFIFKDGLIGTTSVNSLDADGVSYDHPGNNSYYSQVEWSSENRLAPAEAAGKF